MVLYSEPHLSDIPTIRKAVVADVGQGWPSSLCVCVWEGGGVINKMVICELFIELYVVGYVKVYIHCCGGWCLLCTYMRGEEAPSIITQNWGSDCPPCPLLCYACQL